jgi:hypothetical protein
MSLHLEPDEYRKLIELAYLGEWLINAHHDSEVQEEEASLVLQRLLAAAPASELIAQDPETGDYFMKDVWVEQLYESYILDYDDHVFWDELTERLAQRDLARRRGVDMDGISRDEDLMDLIPLEEKYHRELETNGIDRLAIDPDYEA